MFRSCRFPYIKLSFKKLTVGSLFCPKIDASHRRKCSRCMRSCPTPLLNLLCPPPTPRKIPVPLNLPPVHAGVHWRPLEWPGYFGHWCARGAGSTLRHQRVLHLLIPVARRLGTGTGACAAGLWLCGISTADRHEA